MGCKGYYGWSSGGGVAYCDDLKVSRISSMRNKILAITLVCSLVVTLGISSTSDAELHIDGGPEGYADCWITWMEPGPGGKAGLECYEIEKTIDPDVRKDRLNNFKNCKITQGGRSSSRIYLICETV